MQADHPIIKNTITMQVFLRYILLLFIITIPLSCGQSYDIKTRLDTFYKLLDEPTQEQFKAGDLDVVTTYLTGAIADDPEKMALFEQIKRKEAIKLFSVASTVAYFYNHFYLKTQPTNTES
ncbi:hypothetical protein COTS27_01275 [Spirochaetota bacterium]|nr:hypothetical protein COTS27_01275 [Spirochaetota bacterium]